MIMTSKTQNEENYLSFMADVLYTGDIKGDRTGTGTISVNGAFLDLSLAHSFPVATAKKVAYKSAFAEMLCFRDGVTNLEGFHARGCKVWDEFADKQTGDLGPIYGQQWTAFAGQDGTPVNQLRDVLNTLKTRPSSRRMIVTAWNPTFHPDEGTRPYDNPALGKMALTACHMDFQLLTRPLRSYDIGDNSILFVKDYHVANEQKPQVLDLLLHMRSWDLFLGGFFNIAQYALLLSMIAHTHGFVPGKLKVFVGDGHIYLNHVDQVKEMFTRIPLDGPTLKLNPDKTAPEDFFTLDMQDIELVNYQSHGAIKAPVAV
jgi:thymidylate synthase